MESVPAVTVASVFPQIVPPAGEAAPVFRTERCGELGGSAKLSFIPVGDAAKVVFERFPVPFVNTEGVCEVRHWCGL